MKFHPVWLKLGPRSFKYLELWLDGRGSILEKSMNKAISNSPEFRPLSIAQLRLLTCPSGDFLHYVGRRKARYV